MIKLAILFGSSSNEHDVSIVSTCSIIQNLDRDKYQITPIYMDQKNQFFVWNQDISSIHVMPIGEKPQNLTKIAEPFSYLQQFDCIFLMVHGKNGEDGILSSMFDFFHIPYVGNRAMASMISMDKVLTKNELELHHIKTSPYLSFHQYHDHFIYQDQSLDFNQMISVIEKQISYPIFVKPAKSGSSIGITKVNHKEELKEGICKALKVDDHILCEQEIKGKELECAILENKNLLIASTVGEVIPASEFYTFDAKYCNQESKTLIPARISNDEMKQIQELAKKIFQVLNLHQYSRCDFFLTENHEIILNEINTIPGFTTISMYPKLLEYDGYSYSEILDILIENALLK